MNRCDRHEPIFKDDEDRMRFLATLAEACEKTGRDVLDQLLRIPEAANTASSTCK